jgi:hypothetical protein
MTPFKRCKSIKKAKPFPCPIPLPPPPMEGEKASFKMLSFRKKGSRGNRKEERRKGTC